MDNSAGHLSSACNYFISALNVMVCSWFLLLKMQVVFLKGDKYRIYHYVNIKHHCFKQWHCLLRIEWDVQLFPPVRSQLWTLPYRCDRHDLPMVSPRKFFEFLYRRRWVLEHFWSLHWKLNTNKHTESDLWGLRKSTRKNTWLKVFLPTKNYYCWQKLFFGGTVFPW